MTRSSGSRHHEDMRRGTIWNAWRREHDDALREMLEACLPIDRIAARLTERFDIPRSCTAVRRRIRHLDLSTRDGWFSQEETIRLLGLSKRTMQRLERLGHLTLLDFGRWRRYPLPQIEALVRDQAGLAIDPRRVKDPALRSLAETSAIVNRRKAAS